MAKRPADNPALRTIHVPPDAHLQARLIAARSGEKLYALLARLIGAEYVKSEKRASA